MTRRVTREVTRGATLLVGLLLAWVAVFAATLSPSASIAQTFIQPHDAREWVGEPVTMSLRDADLVEVLRSFSRIGQFNLVIHPGVEGKVTVELREVPWDQALSTILRMHGLGLEITGGGAGRTVEIGTNDQLETSVRVGGASAGATSTLAARRTLRGTLEHLDARRVARAFAEAAPRRLLSADGIARAEDASTLVLVDRPLRLQRLGRLVAALDAPEHASLDVDALRKLAVALWPRTSTTSTDDPGR